MNLIGKPGEKAYNWRQYQQQLVGYDIVILMIGGKDICTKDSSVAIESELSDLMKALRELFDFCRNENNLVLIADLVPRLSNWSGIGFILNVFLLKIKPNYVWSFLCVYERELIVDLAGLSKRYLIGCQISSSKIILVRVCLNQSKNFLHEHSF